MNDPPPFSRGSSYLYSYGLRRLDSRVIPSRYRFLTSESALEYDQAYQIDPTNGNTRWKEKDGFNYNGVTSLGFDNLGFVLHGLEGTGFEVEGTGFETALGPTVAPG